MVLFFHMEREAAPEWGESFGVVVMYEIYLLCLLGSGPWSVIISRSHLNRTERVRVGIISTSPSIFHLGRIMESNKKV